MRKVILHLVKATFTILAGCSAFIAPACSQQNIIAGKDNTRPEITNQYEVPATITSFHAISFNGYNEIQWTARSEQDTRKFIVEYSTDGINFQSAGEKQPVNGEYSLQHHTFDTRPLLYRLRIEKINGKYAYSPMILLEGTEIPPVSIYPTVVRGDVINVNAGLPVQRAAVISSDGRQVYVKEMGGVNGRTTLVIPPLEKGIYWITFYGNGWKSTTKFVMDS